ncbi:MAG: hypothetical protein GXY36_13390 [Chloroflexi bacterium]|nr:hypothetical protein [Chloroflexota bacterium]
MDVKHDPEASRLPDWARPDHPVMRYLLHGEAQRSGRLARWVTRIGGLGIAAGLLLLSYQGYRKNTPFAISPDVESGLFVVLYLPLVLLQLFVTLIVLISTESVFSLTAQPQAWQLVRITTHGAGLAVRARWAAVLYQVRWLLALLVVPRLVFVAQMVADLVGPDRFDLERALVGVTPDISPGGAIVLLAALMIGTVGLPLAIIAFNAALGLFLTGVLENRRLATMARLVVLIAEVGIFNVALLFLDLASVRWPYTNMPDLGTLLRLLAVGDQGLRLLDLPSYALLWSAVDYSLYAGVWLLALTIILGVLTVWLIRYTAERAESPSEQ